MKVLQIYKLERSMISINMIGFKSLKWKNGSQVDLNAQIGILSINGYNYDVTLELFPSAVFANTDRLSIGGVIGKLDARLFTQLPIYGVFLKILNLRQFLHNHLDVFADALNKDSGQPLLVALASVYVQKQEQLEDKQHVPSYSKSYYDTYEVELNRILLFEDQDFCLFARYRGSKRKIIFPKTQFSNINFTLKRKGCTCTLMMMTIWNMTMGCDSSNQSFIEACQFEKKFESCKVQAIEPIHQSSAYDVTLAIQMVKFILTILVGPIIALLSIMLNGLTLKVFRMMHDSPEYRANKQKAANNKMWEYLRHNCALNLLQSIVFLFIPLTTCVEFNGIYCSPFILDRPVHWFYILVQAYVGNVLKLMSIVTYSAFVTYRLAFNTDKWRRFRSMQPARVIAGTLICSVIWSVPAVFENGRYGIEVLSKTHYSYGIGYDENAQNSSLFLNIFFLLNKSLINVVLPILNTVFDIWLLRFIKQKTKERKKESSEKKVTKMIVIGGLFSLFFRLPEFVVTIIRILFNVDPTFSPLCVLTYSPMHSICQSLFESAQTFYTIGFLENFLLLYLFNQDFKKALEDFVESKGCCKQVSNKEQ
nr:G protein-coupled receptor [Proales similis]